MLVKKVVTKFRPQYNFWQLRPKYCFLIFIIINNFYVCRNKFRQFLTINWRFERNKKKGRPPICKTLKWIGKPLTTRKSHTETPHTYFPTEMPTIGHNSTTVERSIENKVRANLIVAQLLFAN